ncbi:MAG: type II secretion system F family protein [Thiohalomonadaceae bacterium]
MPGLIWVVLLASLCLLIAVFVLVGKGLRQVVHPSSSDKRVNELLAKHEGAVNSNRASSDYGEWLPPWFESYLERAGMEPTPIIYGVLLVMALLSFLLAKFAFGLFSGLLLTVVAYPLLLTMVLRWRIRQFQKKVIDRLPNFIESVVRILSVGNSLELAFRNASAECDEPLYGITQQIMLRTQAGQSLEDAMVQVADIYAIKELGFVASIFHLGIRYGGNVQTVLERLSQTLRERQRSQQELKAMTSETRASAWILSALPMIVAFLIMTSNPGYLLNFWQDPTGQKVLLSVLGLQIVGMTILFRMARLD